MTDLPRESNWQAATRADLERRELVRLVVQIVRDYYMHWGRWPTAEEILLQVRGSA